MSCIWRLALAIVLEIVANIALKYVNGFRRPLYGVVSLVAVWRHSVPCRRQ